MQRENIDVEMDPNRGEVRSHNSRLKCQTFGEFAGLLIRNAEKEGRSQETGIRDGEPVFRKERTAGNSDSSSEHLPWPQRRNDVQADSLGISSQGSNAPRSDLTMGSPSRATPNQDTSVCTNRAPTTLILPLRGGGECLRRFSEPR